MDLEKIYTTIKQASSAEFYHPDRIEETVFVYIDDARIVLRRINEEVSFGYGYFFDQNGKVVQLFDDYDKLVKQVCEVKDFPETYNNIRTETWVAQINGVSVYWIEVLRISNPSSLCVYMPLSLNPYDFEVNLCNILNDGCRGTMYHIEETIYDSLDIKISTFQDFIRR